jgi:hypothetical protein
VAGTTCGRWDGGTGSRTVANRGGGTVYLWDDIGGENWRRIANIAQGTQLALDSRNNNKADKVEIKC